MDAVQTLVELEALRHLKASYFYYLDTKDWKNWLALWAPDATLEWDSAPSTSGRDGKTVEKVVGIDALAKRVVGELLDPAQTVHQGHTPLIELLSATEARGIWAMEDIVTTADRTMHGFGHYHETYRKIDGKWKFSTVHLKRLRIATTLR